MKAADKDYVVDLYNKSLADYGDTAEGVKWRPYSQSYRFKVLTQVADLETASILDYGCGKGDLYPYLVGQGFRGTYTGFDINSQLIDLARRKYAGVRFEIKDIEEVESLSEQFDYVLVSGVFAFGLHASDSWSVMKSVLSRCFTVAKKGLAFNAISTYVTYREPEFFYASPEEVFQFCMTELSRNVALRHENVPCNFTVYVYRKPEWNH